METGIPTATPPNSNHYQVIPAKEWIEFYQPLEQKYRELESKGRIDVYVHTNVTWPRWSKSRVGYLQIDPVTFAKEKDKIDFTFRSSDGSVNAIVIDNPEYMRLYLTAELISPLLVKALNDKHLIYHKEQANEISRQLDEKKDEMARIARENNLKINRIHRLIRWIFKIKKIQMDE